MDQPGLDRSVVEIEEGDSILEYLGDVTALHERWKYLPPVHIIGNTALHERWMTLMFITYYLSDRAESVDFRNLWSKKSKSLNTVQQNKLQRYYIMITLNLLELFLISVYCFMWYFIKYLIILRGVCARVSVVQHQDQDQELSR